MPVRFASGGEPSSTKDLLRAKETLPSRMQFAGAILVIFVLQFARGMNRHSDPDEYQFTAPPALLTQFHKLPYVDYPYFHMPNLIFVQAILAGWTSHKLLVARILSAVCGTATISLLFHAGWKLLWAMPVRNRLVLVGGVAAIFATCRLFTYTSGNAWNHDSAVVCMLCAFLIHVRGMRTGSVRCIIAAGFLVGFAVGIRLSFAFAVVPLSISIWVGTSLFCPRQRAIAFCGAAIAAATANLPSACLAVLAPRQFVFGNIGYCNLSTAYYRSLPHAGGMTVITKIGSTLSKFVTDPCNLIILVGFVAAVTAWFLPRNRTVKARTPSLRSEFVLLLGIFGCLWLGAMGPTPMMQQYNYMYVPFMVLVILYAMILLPSGGITSQKATRVVASIAIVFGGTGLIRWYWSVIYLPIPSHWQPMIQHREAQWIRGMTGPGTRILTIESEIPLEAGLEIYPQYAVGRFVLLVEKFETPSLRRDYGLVGPGELGAMLAKLPPDAIFTRSDHGCDRPFVEYAISHKFSPHTAPDGFSTLWIKPAPAKRI